MDYIKEYNALLENCLNKRYDIGALLVFCDFLDDYQDRDEFKDLEFSERSKFLRGYCNCFYKYEGITSHNIYQLKNGLIHGNLEFGNVSVVFEYFLIQGISITLKEKGNNELYELYTKIMRIQCQQI